MTMTEEFTKSDGNFIPSFPQATSEGNDLEFSCDVEGCDRSFPTLQGLATHRTRTHGLPSANADATRKRSGRSTTEADEMFERSGRALEVLFPNGIPASRIIELAELQKAMLRALR